MKLVIAFNLKKKFVFFAKENKKPKCDKCAVKKIVKLPMLYINLMQEKQNKMKPVWVSEMISKTSMSKDKSFFNFYE